jgi:signal transduction histidine kinase
MSPTSRDEAPPADAIDEPLVERLNAHRLLSGVPREELVWLAAHGELRSLRTGDVVVSPDLGPVEEMWVLFTGRLAVYRVRDGVQRKLMDWTGGDVTGLLPYSRLGVARNIGRAEEPTQMLVVHARHMEEMCRECHVITTRLVQAMLDRARHFQKEDLHQARLASLGRLAAGLAHELDNPASAVVRGAKLLEPLLGEADSAARALGEAGLPAAQFELVEQLRDRCLDSPLQQVRSPLEQARHEEAISDWLDDRGIALKNVDTLTETPVTVETLDQLAETVEPTLLEPAIRWIAAVCAVRGIAGELGNAAVRISDLVRAVKGFTQMDAAPASQPVDLELGLTQTLAVLRSKARAKSVRVNIAVEPGLPPVRAVAGELNQIWANLLENAVDAVGSGGSVEIRGRLDGDAVTVQFIDDGPGIPARVREKIFEPFFTTKPVGEGTGLGLDIVRRLVERHDGSIELTSDPGRTEFRVRLPVHEGDAGSAAS